MTAYYNSPIGTLLLEEQDGAVTRIACVNETKIAAEESSLLRCLISALDGYFSGEREDFALPLAPAGTDFQKKVWAELRRISYGKTASYKEIAERACGSARYARAVASAAHRNPILLAIPCHRMIASDGSPGGFAPGNTAKELLLMLERDTENRK